MTRAHCPPGPGTLWIHRLLALGLLIVLVVALGIAAGTVLGGAQQPVAGVEQHMVKPGQTLLEVASETAPDRIGTRRQLHALREVNGLGADPISAWQVLVLPAW